MNERSKYIVNKAMDMIEEESCADSAPEEIHDLLTEAIEITAWMKESMERLRLDKAHELFESLGEGGQKEFIKKLQTLAFK